MSESKQIPRYHFADWVYDHKRYDGVDTATQLAWPRECAELCKDEDVAPLERRVEELERELDAALKARDSWTTHAVTSDKQLSDTMKERDRLTAGIRELISHCRYCSGKGGRNVTYASGETQWSACGDCAPLRALVAAAPSEPGGGGKT